MNKSRGVLIVSIVAVAAIGLFLYMRRHRDERAPAPAVTTKGSAQHAQPVAEAHPDPAKLVVTVSDDKGPLAGATVRFERERGDV